MQWSDLYKLWSQANNRDPISRIIRSRKRNLEGSAGVTQPDAIPDLRSDGSYWSGGSRGALRIRDGDDFIDLSSITNRQSRYKEYERLRVVPEIETALTVFADESCVTGDTLVATPIYGYISIKELAAIKKPEDKFLVYCFDFKEGDYGLGWAYHPRLVKKAPTVKIVLDNGTSFSCTEDHRVLLRTAQWIAAGNIKKGDELMPFYRIRPEFLGQPRNRFPKIFTLKHGWKHERAFVDEWKSGTITEDNEVIYKVARMISEGLNTKQIQKIMGKDWDTIRPYIETRGYSAKELRSLQARFSDRRKVVSVIKGKEEDVYDLSVEEHENFATNTTIFHNCQIGSNGHLFEIIVNNEDVKKELDFLFFHPRMLNMDRRLWNLAKNLYINGDFFYELIIDPTDPKAGILNVQSLPADSMYRIETIKGKVLEFQQSNEGPDYQSLARVEVTKATSVELAQATAIRFTPEQIVHFKIGDDRRLFYPYGVSLIEPARGPAHSLKLMEESMLIYRLCLIGLTKIKTATSYKKIEDINVGDTVYSYENGTSFKSKVVNKWMTGIKDVYEVKSKTTSITGTGNHPILVKDKITEEIKYVPILELDVNKHQFIHATIEEEIPKKINRFPDRLYGRLTKKQKEKYKLSVDKTKRIVKVLNKIGLENNQKNVQKGFCFLTHKDNFKLSYDFAQELANEFELGKTTLLMEHEKEPERINLPKYVDREFAELMGFLIGDGCINYWKTSGKLIFTAGIIPSINKKYANLLRKYFGRCSFRKEKRSDKEEVGEYVVNCYAACRIMEEMGLKGDCYTKRIPEWVFTERKEIRKAFILGLADAEGSKRNMCDETWRTEIGLTNEKLSEDIKEVWRSLGLHSSHLRKIEGEEGGFNWNGRIYDKKDSWSIYLSETPCPEFEDILSVEYKGQEEVYDIEVDSSVHNFVAEGVVVHNSRAPERRVFYIDVGTLPPFRAEMIVDKLKDSLRKKKHFSNKGDQGTGGASSVNEQWVPMTPDEDIFIPTRPNANTRVDVLPGAQNLSEIDDSLYFRNKLFVSLNFPKNYMGQEDSQITKVTLSTTNVKFAMLIERLQQSIADGLTEIAIRHLELRGYPADCYDDLQLKMTPPSPYREYSTNEITDARYNRALSLKGSQLYSDFDILVDILKVPPEKAKEIIARATVQKVQDFKFQMMAANPELFGVAQDSSQGAEMGTEAGGPSPMLTGQEGMPPEGMPPEPMPTGAAADNPPPEPEDSGKPKKIEHAPIPDASEEDIKKYGLEIPDYNKFIDEEEIDVGELDDY